MVSWRSARLTLTFSLLFYKPPFSCFSRWVAIPCTSKLENEDLLQQQEDPHHNQPLFSHTDFPDCLHQAHITHISADFYVSLLQWCISSLSLVDGMHVHTLIIKHSLEHHDLLGRRLLHMYVACGTMSHAHALFSRLLHQSIYSWNLIIKGYIKHGFRKEALCMYVRIEQAELQPDLSTFITVISAYTKPEVLDEGKVLHSRIVEDKHDSDRVINTALVHMYGRCGDLESAHTVSEHISVRDIVVWNELISVHVHHGRGAEALALLHQMQQEGIFPNRVTFVGILAACAGKELLAAGQRIHFFIVNSRCESDTVVGTALLSMYSKCGSANDARRVFDNLFIQDQISWNAMIAVYIKHGLRKQALQLLEQMEQVAMPTDIVTYINILDACVGHGSLREVKRMHTCIVCRGFHTDVVVGTALLNMYSKCESLEDARKVFDGLPVRDPITWNAMLAAQSQHCEGKQTAQFFARMLLEGVLPCRASFASALSGYVDQDLFAEGKRLHVRVEGSRLISDIVMGNALVNMYGKCGCLEDAHMVFERLPQRDTVSWNSLISACAQLEHRDKAWQLFQQMQQEGLQRDQFTFVSILDACITQAALIKGKLVHSYALSSGFDSDVMVGTASVTMYGKCGSLKDAERAFNHMPKQSVVSWNAIIGTFAQHGEAKQALHYFEKMKQKSNPDKITFTIILSACSHAGLVDEGCDVFISMAQVYGVTPSTDHFACMIDLLGRVGRLADAEDLLRIAPCERNAVLYKTLLGACRHQGDVERGEHAANSAFRFDHEDPTPFVILSNIYSAADKGADDVSYSKDYTIRI